MAALRGGGADAAGAVKPATPNPFNLAVASRDQTTRENAAPAEDASAAADVPKTQTGQLSAAIAAFRLPEQC
jgi:methyl-accepting chemotaxis protein